MQRHYVEVSESGELNSIYKQVEEHSETEHVDSSKGPKKRKLTAGPGGVLSDGEDEGEEPPAAAVAEKQDNLRFKTP